MGLNVKLPLGYSFVGHTAGIKESGKPDLALVASDRSAACVGMFTTNRVCAAPVQICRQRLPSTSVRGLVINSGNANACTGDRGLRDAEAMTAALAKAISCETHAVLVASTGVIGRPLAIDAIVAGIHSAAGHLGSTANAFDAATNAILTTDTRAKVAGREIRIGKQSARILGFAKGAAMIGPNMATMLAFVLTDAAATVGELQPILKRAVDRSFHCIGVEGHTSTNDTVLLVANGASGSIVSDGLAQFEEAVEQVCIELARAIVADAEGASKFIALKVTGCRSDADARQIAKAIAESALAKAAFFGNDPNWGRICSAAGYAGVAFDEKDMSLKVNGTVLYERGQPTAFDPKRESDRMKANREVDVELTFSLGTGHCTFWTCDLTTDYVRLNADYTT